MKFFKTPLNLQISGLLVIVFYHVVKFDADSVGISWIFIPAAAVSCFLFFVSFVMWRERNIGIYLAFFAISFGFSVYSVVGAAVGDAGAQRALSSGIIGTINSIAVGAFVIGLAYIGFLKISGRLPEQN